jgi:hypothetical protein
VAALAVVAASIVTAIVIPYRTQLCCWSHGPHLGTPKPCTAGYPMALRLRIVAAGSIVAGLISVIGRYARRRRG